MFKLYDNYEGDMELLGSGTLKKCKKLARERIDDTDGECYLIIDYDEGKTMRYFIYEYDSKQMEDK